MGQVAVTGASGFIGRAVCTLLRSQGDDVIELRRGGVEPGARRWSLGEPLPEACRFASAIVHLASATLTESGARRAAAIQTDIEGARLIVQQIRQWRREGSRHRLVFVSSQSASPQAVNAYGRSKWTIEQMLDEDDELVIRPGLVYSDQPHSVFAMFDKLSRLPIVPIVSSRLNIQPIHVREVAFAVARACTIEPPPKLLMIGALQPLSFAEAIRATARRSGRRAPAMVPVPIGPVRLVATLVDRLLGSAITERLDGVAGLQPISTASSLAVLGQALDPF